MPRNPMVYKFNHHPGVSDEPPESEHTRRLDKAFGDEPLTREEKDRIGAFRAGRAAYRQGGWAWPMWLAKQMQRILVRERDSVVFEIYYAADKTALRAHHPVPSRIVEMIYAPRKGD